MGWKEYSDKLKEWYGYSEAKNQDDIIIDIYNSQRLAGSYKMSHTDPWCHATVSAAAYASGNAGSVPNTCYCPTGIQTFKQWGRWTGRQADTYNPQPGDIVYYDWNHDQISDHVGTVIARNGNMLVVREGNRNDMLCDRQIDVNSSYIMGYGIPRWDEAVKETVTDNPAGTTGNHTKPSVDTGYWIARVQAECNKQGFSSQKVDGIAGKNTLAGCPMIRKGAKGNLTALVQEKLNATGYDCGKVDGIFGSGTEKAVKNLQKAHGLVQDGIVGKRTWRILLGM